MEKVVALTRNRNLALALLFALSLWLIASLPGDDLQRIQSAPTNPLLALAISDPVMHLLVSALLALLVCRSFWHPVDRFTPFKAAFIAWGYGLLIEVYQGLLPWRSFGVDDLMWNTAGVVCFLVLFELWQVP